MTNRLVARFVAASAVLALSACGGGGGSSSFRPEPTPPPSPPPPPPPPQAEAVTIFSNPTAQDYASVGVWGNIGDVSSPPYSVDFTSVTSADSSQPKIRYTSGGYYEVQLPGNGYGQLVHDPAITNPTSDNTVFGIPAQRASFVITKSRSSGYSYSEMARWARPDLDFGQTVDLGFVAFGTPTPVGAVPTTGSASFQGQIFGATDLPSGACDCGAYPVEVEGTVLLSFNFGAGTLGGSMSMALSSGWGAEPVGDYNFTQTVYSPGGTTYSGRFDTNLSGDNFFLGRFTGPSAQETIGAWAVPFTFQNGTHQAIGAWIAKRGQ